MDRQLFAYALPSSNLRMLVFSDISEKYIIKLDWSGVLRVIIRILGVLCTRIESY